MLGTEYSTRDATIAALQAQLDAATGRRLGTHNTLEGVVSLPQHVLCTDHGACAYLAFFGAETESSLLGLCADASTGSTCPTLCGVCDARQDTPSRDKMRARERILRQCTAEAIIEHPVYLD